mmetsp:Transcript_21384/g.47489  ORF Transcript_21384/g.47489 Transcript_21384/m.47489 type:complete len:109 (-) Transcript_21384:59-385(-)
MEPTLAPTPSPSNSAQPSGIYTLVIVFVAVVVMGVFCWLARKCQLWRAHVAADGHRGAERSSYVLWRGREPLGEGDDETVDENMDCENVDENEDVEAELRIVSVHIDS